MLALGQNNRLMWLVLEVLFEAFRGVQADNSFVSGFRLSERLCLRVSDPNNLSPWKEFNPLKRVLSLELEL